ncbi:MAG TPA: hypothetical protein VFG59_17875 [Anaeromyxobacter sp.]|nr:hypothetical protein [Anaeromyxobacter sp.]
MPSLLALLALLATPAAPAAPAAGGAVPAAATASPATAPVPVAPSVNGPAIPTSPLPERTPPASTSAPAPQPAGKGDNDKPDAERSDLPGPEAEKLPSRPSSPRAEASSPMHPLTTTPPSLTARALLEELRRTSKERQAEQGGMAEQRQKLEALKQEIEKSREALREETKRLQELVTTAGVPDGAKRQAGKDPLDALAKTARGMKPEQAAAMMAKLDRGLAVLLLSRMRPADAALLLEKMEPATSAALVSLLARKDRS